MSERVIESITDEVIQRLQSTADPRTKLINESFVRHLHEFILEIRPTMQEWESAITFLTVVGQTCTPERQEFILFSDTLGASTLVTAINAPADARATESTVLGPFYLSDPESFGDGAAIDGGQPGIPLFIEGSVIDASGTPCEGAVVDIWQSNADGSYDVQNREPTRYLRGRFLSDSNGRFTLWSVVPSSYSIPDDGPVGMMLKSQGRHSFRPAHVHFRISCDGYSQLTTHIFVKGDPYLGSDAVFGVRESLIEEFVPREPEEAPESHPLDIAFASLQRTFVLAPLAAESPFK